MSCDTGKHSGIIKSTLIILCTTLLVVSHNQTDASEVPFTIENCGLAHQYKQSPRRAVSINQAATEIMLALGLEGELAGTAYLDDQILPEYQTAYQKVPVLAKEYPSKEVLIAVERDFVYAAYNSAFDPEAAGSREELQQLNIASYLSPSACLGNAKVTVDTIYSEIRDIGKIFGVRSRAENLIADMQKRLASVNDKIRKPVQPIKLFWFDSGLKEPVAGACCGVPNEIIRLVHAENIFADVPKS
ncbi:ABC transporter substrate-binding protein [bacterium]|nr:ABC transporter substrate-binding protein [bacterium]MCI0619298.1 ABC transporter substrate-binding protein [bacterium]